MANNLAYNMDGSASSNNFVDTFTPDNGGNVNLRNSDMSGMVILNPAASIASATVVLPNDASTQIGQRLTIVAMKPILLLNWSGGTLLNARVALDTNDAFDIRKTAPNTWVTIQ